MVRLLRCRKPVKRCWSRDSDRGHARALLDFPDDGLILEAVQQSSPETDVRQTEQLVRRLVRPGSNAEEADGPRKVQTRIMQHR